MATSTTNYSFSLPEVGGDTDQWGTQLNANWTLADSTIKTIEDSVVDVTLTGNDYLTISGQAITVGDVDLTADVTGTLPVGSGGTGLAALGSANQVLAVNATADGLEFQTISGSGTVTSVAVTGSDGIEIDSGAPVTTSGTIALGINATSLSTHLGLGSLATQSTITESQISDLGSYITASSTDTLTNKSGNISQWTNDANYITAESNDLSSVVTWANVPDINITESSVTQHQAALSITESQISDFGSYQTSDAGLTSIAGLTTAADKMLYTTAADTYAVTTLTTAGRALLDDADAAAQRITLGLGTAATSNTSAFEASGAVSTHAAVTSSVHGISAFGATLVDDADAPAARTTLGLGSLATQSTITESQISDLQSYLTAEVNDLSAAVTGTLGTANGGTGLTSIGTAGQVLTVNSGANALEYQTPLVALPITDSQGNNVLSESGSVVTLTADEANVGSNALVVDSSGNVGVGSSPAFKLDVTGSSVPTIRIDDAAASGTRIAGRLLLGASSTLGVAIENSVSSFNDNCSMVFKTTPPVGTITQVFIIDSSGNVGAPSGSNIYSASDQRLKQNITDLSGCLQKVLLMRGVSFNWIDNFCDSEADKTLYGLIAQELQTVDVNLVDSFSDSTITAGEVTVENPLRVNEKFIIPMLVESIKEQQTIIESQQSQIDALTARIEALENT